MHRLQSCSCSCSFGLNETKDTEVVSISPKVTGEIFTLCSFKQISLNIELMHMHTHV